MNLVIITTAITRGDFHKHSIGKFYELYWDIIKNMFDVYHIINLDLPNKLKDTYDKEFSVNLFATLIPTGVNVTLIDNPNPGFLQAYKNVVNKVTELKLNSDSLIWWFEDDWESCFNPELFNIVKLFNMNNPVAFNSTANSPLCSFRGGPIMTSSFFNKYFNLEHFGVANNTCDPERQVNRWISGINRTNGDLTIHRDISHDNKVNIAYFYYGDSKINVAEYPFFYYENAIKFNQDLQFTYHAIQSHDLTTFEYGCVNNKQLHMIPMDIQSILKNIDSDGITYICIKPWTFSDIGRRFNKAHSLIKWANANDGTSYI